METIEKYDYFCTDSKNGEDLYDMIAIDATNKKYYFHEDVTDEYIDMGYDDDVEPIYVHYVSRDFYDFLLNSVKLNGFTKND